MRPEVRDYYRRGGEQHRLAAGTGRLEFLRTWDLLARVLPGAPATVLDVGGATGAYAGPLAGAGYRVHLVDPMPEHAAAAAAVAGVTATVGDARALPVADRYADAVLLLGPLYHLLDRAERVAAWREAARAARPGAVVVGATISRYAPLLDGYTKSYFDDPRFGLLVGHTLATGVHQNPDAEPGWFTTAYFHRPDEPAGEAAEAGLTVARVSAVEGPVWLGEAALAEILADPVRTGQLLAQLRRVEDEPSLLGASAHLLTVAHTARP